MWVCQCADDVNKHCDVQVKRLGRLASITNFANNTESVDSNGEESLSEDNADGESDAENG
jgi:hypothetical protein